MLGRDERTVQNVAVLTIPHLMTMIIRGDEYKL
jgi:hypothetical protein